MRSRIEAFKRALADWGYSVGEYAHRPTGANGEKCEKYFREVMALFESACAQSPPAPAPSDATDIDAIDRFQAAIVDMVEARAVGDGDDEHSMARQARASLLQRLSMLRRPAAPQPAFAELLRAADAVVNFVPAGYIDRLVAAIDAAKALLLHPEQGAQ